MVVNRARTPRRHSLPAQIEPVPRHMFFEVSEQLSSYPTDLPLCSRSIVATIDARRSIIGPRRKRVAASCASPLRGVALPGTRVKSSRRERGFSLVLIFRQGPSWPSGFSYPPPPPPCSSLLFARFSSCSCPGPASDRCYSRPLQNTRSPRVRDLVPFPFGNTPPFSYTRSKNG